MQHATLLAYAATTAEHARLRRLDAVLCSMKSGARVAQAQAAITADALRRHPRFHLHAMVSDVQTCISVLSQCLLGLKCRHTHTHFINAEPRRLPLAHLMRSRCTCVTVIDTMILMLVLLYTGSVLCCAVLCCVVRLCGCWSGRSAAGHPVLADMEGCHSKAQEMEVAAVPACTHCRPTSAQNSAQSMVSFAP